jgi:hypothetical protein
MNAKGKDLHFSTDRPKGSTFFSIHSKGKKGDAARVVLQCSEEHKKDMRKHGEIHAVISEGRDFTLDDRQWAQDTAKEYEMMVERSARGVGINLRGQINGVEMVMSNCSGAGQEWHMDQTQNNWNAFVTTTRGQLHTEVAETDYQEFPQNLGPESNVPLKWGDLRCIDIGAEWGDMLLVKGNMIHRAGPEERVKIHSTVRNVRVARNGPRSYGR